MGVKFKKKCFRNIKTLSLSFLFLFTSLIDTSETSVEGRSLTKRRVHHNDYDEMFGFELMSDDPPKRTHHLLKGDDLDSLEDFVPSTVSKSVVKPAAKANVDGVVFAGCYHAWLEHQRNFQFSKYDETHTPQSCSDRCQERREKWQLSLMRGGVCHCMDMASFTLINSSVALCDVPCPISHILSINPSSTVAPEQSCGGNIYFSVYCRTNATEDCQNVPDVKPLDIISHPTIEDSRVSVKSTEPKLLMECAACPKSDPNCLGYANLVNTMYDYFPKNDPYSCVKFCSNVALYKDIRNNTARREPTKYAVLTWGEFRDSQTTSYVLPICKCTDDLGVYEPVEDVSSCHTPCPGDRDQVCGNSNVMSTNIYSTIYHALEKSDETSPPTTGSTGTTPEATSPCPTNGVKNDEPCDPGTEGTTGAEITSTEITSTEPTTITITTTSTSTTTEAPTTTPWPNTTILTTPFLIETTETSTFETEETTFSSPLTFPTKPPSDIGIDCHLFCLGTEKSNGRSWKVCAGDKATKACVNENSWGTVTWKCLDTGQFETDQPDYSNCHSHLVGDLENRTKAINDTKSAVQFLTDLKSNLTDSSEAAYFGHEMKTFTEVLSMVVKMAGNFTEHAGIFEEIAEKVVDISHHLITTAGPWFEMSNESRSTVSTDLINTIEETSIHLTAKVDLSPQIPSYQKDLTSNPGYYVSAGAMSKLEDGASEDPLEFPASRSPKTSFIKLPPGWKDIVQGPKIEFVGMSVDPQYANLMMPGQYKSLGVDPSSDSQHEAGQKLTVINSQLMSFTLASTDGSRSIVTNNNVGRSTIGDDSKLDIQFREQGVQITFEHDLEAWGDETVDIRRKLHPGETPKAALGTSQCVYWDTNHSQWSKEGCKLISNTRYQTVCECSHLTSFAILMDVHNYVGKELGLEILTLMLCSLSFICLFVSVLIFSTIRGVQNMRTTITKNLAICLLIGNTLVLLVLDRSYLNMTDDMCLASGILTHYVFLSAFIWMGIEGVHLYKMVVHVFDTEKNPLNIYRLISYGLPLIIVAVTVVIGYLKGDRPYGGDVNCWLDGNYIWSFMVPVAIVVMVNFVILFIALKTAYQLQHNTRLPVLFQSRVRSFRTWIRGCFSLTVLLGLTWLVGFFTLIPSAPGIAAAYLFTILNASQGIFIFTYHCILNDKIRFQTSKRFGSYLPSWLSSSVVNNSSTGSQANDPSGFGKEAVSSTKKSNSDFRRSEKSSVHKPKSKSSREINPRFLHPVESLGKIKSKFKTSKTAKAPTSPPPPKDVVSMDETGGGAGSDGSISVITPIPTRARRMSLLRKRDSFGTVSSTDSLRPDYSSGNVSDSGNMTDNSMRGLISDKF